MLHTNAYKLYALYNIMYVLKIRCDKELNDDNKERSKQKMSCFFFKVHILKVQIKNEGLLLKVVSQLFLKKKLKKEERNEI